MATIVIALGQDLQDFRALTVDSVVTTVKRLIGVSLATEKENSYNNLQESSPRSVSMPPLNPQLGDSVPEIYLIVAGVYSYLRQRRCMK